LCSTGEWADFFAENNILVGLSIERAEEDTRRNELTPPAKGHSIPFIRATEILKKAGAEFKYPERRHGTRRRRQHTNGIYRFYKKNGFPVPSVYPLHRSPRGFPGSAGTIHSRRKKYGNFLCRLFDMWYEDFQETGAPVRHEL
jgi:uncharacterized protein